MSLDDPSQSPPQSSLADRFPTLDILSESPENAQVPTRDLYTSVQTPREHHYVRNHYPTPWIDEDEWTVSLTGLVDECELSVETIKHSYPTESVGHTMTCAGFGRAAFDPPAGGLPWSFGPLGTAIWTGTPVRDILTDCGVDMDDSLWLSVMGGDAPSGEDIYCRSLPMWKIVDDCLLAYEMNGAPLTRDHGYPVRLLVPGWYGNNSVKWVKRLHVMETMVCGPEWDGTTTDRYTHWQQDAYRLIPAQDDAATHYSSIDVFDTRAQMAASDRIRNAYMYDQLVNSLITQPSGGMIAPDDDETITVRGVAWAGDDVVERVDLSVDGGCTWAETTLCPPALGRYTWQQFGYEWDCTPGEYTLVSRATDEQGRHQPATIACPADGRRGPTDDTYPWNKAGYGNNAYTSHPVKLVVV